MSLIIRESSITELEGAPNIMGLLDEYALESSIGGLPHPSAKVETYRHLESVGAIRVIGAFLDDILIGFITVLAPVLPHYGVRIAVGESFFVSHKHRKTGAGLKLLRAVEDYVEEIGAYGLLISAPFGGNLAEVLPHIGYAETNRVFFKGARSE